jgi:xylose isomerase
MPGLSMMHAVAQAWEAGKLFHIDLNDQYPGRFDQDLRFGSVSVKQSFWLVKFLEDVGYDGMRHFDAHAYRTEDHDGVKDFARGCMRTYLIFKDKARRWNEHAGIRSILDDIAATDEKYMFGKFSEHSANSVLSKEIDRHAIAKKGLQYERLDQLTMDILLGVDG